MRHTKLFLILLALGSVFLFAKKIALAFTVVAPYEVATEYPPLTFTVNDAQDRTDTNVGDQKCDSNLTVVGEQCTLRAAIQEANEWPGKDVIDVRATSYTITLAGDNEDYALTGDFDIIDDVIIKGEGETTTFIDANQLDRIFHIIGAIDVDIRGLTLLNGKTAVGEDGGAIFNSSNANTIISSSTIRNNFADQWGGGVANDENAKIEFNDVLIIDNVAGVLGGGIDNHNAVAALNNSQILRNVAQTGSGGGIYNDGTFSIDKTVIAENTAKVDGAGIFNFKTLGVSDSSIYHNVAEGDGGGILNAGDWIGKNLTIHNNKAGRDAGGVFNLHSMALTHVTIANNQAANLAGGLFNDGIAKVGLTIIANNLGRNCERYHTIDSLGHNLESGSDCFLNSATDLQNSDPLLAELVDIGEAMGVLPLSAGSPAIDSADSPLCLEWDQRGIARPQGNYCDRGAYEYNLADLSLIKLASAETVYAGQPIEYHFSVANAGDSDATQVVISDTIPTGATYLGYSENIGWSCQASSTAVRCEYPLVSAFTTAPTLQLDFSAPSEATTMINQAELSSAVGDDFLTNNRAVVTTTVIASADLRVTAQTNPVPVEIGHPLPITISVENVGVTVASMVTLTVPLNTTEVSFDSWQSDQWQCSATSEIVTCLSSSLPIGTSDIVLSFLPLVGDTTLYIPLEVQANTHDLNLANNQTVATLGDVLISRADLSLGVIALPNPADAGSLFTYQLNLANAGPNVADGVKLVHQLPNGVVYQGVEAPNWNCSLVGTTLNCDRASFGDNQQESIFVTVLLPAEPEILTTEATLSAETVDPNSANDTGIATLTMVSVADLTLNVSADVAVAEQNNPLTYTLLATNLGPSLASQVRVSYTLSADLTLIDSSGDGWSCGEQGSTIICDRPTIPVGIAPPILIETNVNQPASEQWTTTGIISSTTKDDQPANNSSTSVMTLGQNDLSVAIVAPPARLWAGETFPLVVRVTNDGESVAENIVVSYTIPEGTTFDQSSGEGWNCNQEAQLLSCTTASLAPGISPDLKIDLIAPSSATLLSHSLTVTTTSYDPNSANNQTSATTTVNSSADLVLQLAQEPQAVVAGENLSYTVTLLNHGVSSAESITLTHAFPIGFAYDSFVGNGWNCQAIPPQLSCTLPTLQADGTSPLTIIGRATTTADSLSIDLDVTAVTHDPIANNIQTVLLGDSQAFDLSLTLSQVDPIVSALTTMQYQIDVSNSGPAVASLVTVEQLLPTNSLFLSADGEGWTCELVGNLLTCQRPEAPVGNLPPIVIEVTAPSEGTVVSTQATVSAEKIDINAENDRDILSTTIQSSADLSLDIRNLQQAGDSLSYDLAIANDGPSMGRTVVVTQTWPTEFSYQGYQTESGWQCQRLGNNLTCSADTLLPSATATIRLNLIRVKPFTTIPVLTAQLTNAVAETDLSNNRIDTPLVWQPSTNLADLSITMSDAPDPANINSVVTYTVNLSNEGIDSAENLSVTITLPQLATYQSADGVGWDCQQTAQTLICTKPSLGVGQTDSFRFYLQSGATTGSLIVTAQVTAKTPDTVTSNNRATAVTTIHNTNQPITADLVLHASDSADPVLVGQLVTYTIEIENRGPDAAEAISFLSNLPAQATLQNVVSADWTCDYLMDEHQLKCSRPILAANTTAPTIQIVVLAPDQAVSLSNNMSVNAPALDGDETNNYHVERTQLIESADLTLSASPLSTVLAGSSYSYTVTLTNAGPSDANETILTHTLPAEGTYINSLAPENWECTFASPNVICRSTTLPVGTQTLSFLITAPAEPLSLTHQLTVSSVLSDSTPIDNTVVQTIGMIPVSELHVTVADQWQDEIVRYEIAVTNDGPSQAEIVTTTIQLGDDVTYQTMSGEGWQCQLEPAQALLCHYAGGEVGLLPPLVITTTHNPDVSSTTATVTVTSTSYDSDNSDNLTLIITKPTIFIYLPIIVKP